MNLFYFGISWQNTYWLFNDLFGEYLLTLNVCVF
jgi:hypothetical protein